MGLNKFFKSALILTTALLLASDAVYAAGSSSPAWGYECDKGKCVKVPFKNEYSTQSLGVCRLLCGGEKIGTLWPQPTGPVKIGEHVTRIDRKKITFQGPSNGGDAVLWEMVKSRFLALVDAKIPEGDSVKQSGRELVIGIRVEAKSVPALTYETNESYTLKIHQVQKQVFAAIDAPTFFGARHGLETLSQLIVYNDVGESLQILIDTEINDAPVYKHRGVLLDTARHYFSVKAIKRTLDGMAMTKLNTFHWHMIDSNSFPLVVKSHPDLHRLGAYSPHKIYTSKDIIDVDEYARVRGIRVIPEFDGPAHTGEGWQKKNMTVCFNAQPWKNFCNQPPCGQLDPTKSEVYKVLEDIYREMFDAFEPNIFHMGGDTASISCWNSSEAIRDWMTAKGWGLETKDFLKLWRYYHSNAVDRLDSVSSAIRLPIIQWDSQLTSFLDKSRYIIQTVLRSDQEQLKQLLQRGFQVILTDFELFINGDTSNWSGGGNLAGWQKFYRSRVDGFAERERKLVLGAEAAVWSEQIDEFTLDGLLWPKASALAERLWSDPKENWHKAEARLLLHREVLAENGIAAEAVQPEWCFLNEKECPRDAYD